MSYKRRHPKSCVQGGGALYLLTGREGEFLRCETLLCGTERVGECEDIKHMIITCHVSKTAIKLYLHTELTLVICEQFINLLSKRHLHNRN